MRLLEPAAQYVHLTHRTHGRIVYDEVLCRRCYDALTPTIRAEALPPGQSVDVEAWRGEPQCAACDHVA